MLFTCLDARLRLSKLITSSKATIQALERFSVTLKRTTSSSGSPDSGHTLMTGISGIRGTMA